MDAEESQNFVYGGWWDGHPLLITRYSLDFPWLCVRLVHCKRQVPDVAQFPRHK